MRNRPLCSICLFVCLVIWIGTVCGGEKLVKELRPSAAESHLKDKEDVLVTGRVYQKADKEKYQIIYLKNNSMRYRQQSLKESRLIIYDEHKEKVNIGDVLTVHGEIGFFLNARNPGNFDSKLYYQKQDIHANVWTESIQKEEGKACTLFEKLENNLYQFRQSWKSKLCEEMGDQDGNTLSAMILGEKSQMDEELRELYQKNGIGHILAISGLHLSFIGIGVYKILRRVTGSYPIGGIFGILFLMLYILMIGFTVSAVRALVMFLFRVGADMTGRHYDAPTALSFAAAAVLLWRPLSLYDGGFWLSFGAVFAILAVVPAVQEGISIGTLHSNGQKMKMKTKVSVQENLSIYTSHSTDVPYNGLAGVTSNRKGELQSPPKRNREDSSISVYLIGAWGCVRHTILQGLTASIGINLVILPILLYYFFEFPLYSFVLNLFVIPLMSVLLFLGMAGSLLALWFVPISALLFWMCSKILWIYKMSCEITLHLPGARLVIGRPDLWQIAVYYGILLLGLLLLRYMVLSVKTQEGQKEKGNQADWRNRKKKQIAMFILWAVGIMILTTRFGEAGKFTTVVLDVGQGDGIFMRGPEGGTYLVDGGSSDIKNVGQYRLEPFLKSQGVGKLDYVLISHGDSDHMNGVEELIERQKIGVKIGTLVLPVKEAWDEALEELAGKARNHGIRVAVIEPGQSIREGEMVLTCIQPGNVGIKSEDAESRQEKAVPGTGSTGLEPGNGASMVLAVQYGEFDMLFTGDVEEEGEKQLTKQLEESYEDCTWEVLKVAHHGSKNSSAEEFLQQVQPAYALISAGQGNRYGHPHQETVKRFADVGSRVYSTQENGAIIVEVEGGEILRMEKWQR